MTTRSHPLIVPQCSACIRRLAQTGIGAWRPPFAQQIRGKKKLAKKNQPDTVPARLLKDVRLWGRKGAIVPLSLGELRNRWLPQRIAAYVTEAQMRELKAKNIVPERDYTFQSDNIKGRRGESKAKGSVASTPEPVPAAAAALPAPAPRPVDLELLSPERSTELINILVPRHIDFNRTPIENESPAAPEPTRLRAASSAAADLAAASMPPPKPKPVSIYGSVSTSDVVSSIKESLAGNDEAARVVLTEGDVKFVGLEEADAIRVKHLGDYEIEIQVKGAGYPVKRTVRVRAQSTM